MPCCADHWTTLDAGAQAADDLLADIFGLRTAHKDDRSYLTRTGFEIVLRDITRELILIAKPHDQRRLQACLQALDTNWRGLSPAQRDAAIDRAAAALGGVPQVQLGAVTQLLTRVGQQIVTGTKRSHDLPINAAFDLVDEKVVQHAAQSRALFVRDEYGRRSVAASQRAREIVSGGIEAGLDRYDIGKRLEPEMARIGVQRSAPYWENVGSIFAARARTWGSLSAFTEAGVTEYEIVETMDQVTCSCCRLMHGRVFSTGSAASRYQQVADSDDPEAVRDFQPFLGLARNKDTGEEAIYFKRGGERRAIATVAESGVGKVDAPGRYTNVMQRGGMEAAGISTPPFHGRCRGGLTASERGLVQVPVEVAAPAPVPVEHTVVERPKVVRAPRTPKVWPEDDDALVPRWTASDTAGPDGLPEFRNASGDPPRGAIENADKIRALYALPSDRGRVTQPSPLLAPSEPVPTDYLKSFEDVRKRAAAKRKKYDTAKLAAEYGAEVPLSTVDLLSVVQPPTLSRSRLAAALAHDYPGTTPEHMPVVVKHGGKFYLHAGAEELLGDQAHHAGSTVVRLIDLDKLKRPTIDPAEWAGRARGAFNVLASGSAGVAEQKAVRESVRELLAAHGIATSDDHREHGLAFAVRPNPAMNEIRVDEGLSRLGADGIHNWNGSIGVRQYVADRAKDVLARMQVGRPVQQSDASHLGSFIHEELHGASRMFSISYTRCGAAIEESITEIVARKITRDVVGQPMFSPLPVHGSTGQAYDDTIHDLIRRVGAVTGEATLRERVESAAMEVRRWKGGREVWVRPEDQVKSFVDALGIANRRQRAQLEKDLIDNLRVVERPGL